MTYLGNRKEFIQLRLSPKMKEEIRSAAQAEGITMTAFVELAASDRLMQFRNRGQNTMNSADKIMQGLEIAPRERNGKIELVVVSPDTDTRAAFWLSDVVCDLITDIGRLVDAGTFEAEKPRFEMMWDDAFEMLSALRSAVNQSSKVRVSGTFTAEESRKG